MTDHADSFDATDRLAMALALGEARQALAHGDVPVGCVLVAADGQVIAAGHNERELASDPTAHAEIVVLRRAADVIGHWRLLDTTAYVTLEPCPMCAGALVNARVSRVVWAAGDPKAGGMQSKYTIGVDGQLNHTLVWRAGLLEAESVALLRSFFAGRRRR